MASFVQGKYLAEMKVIFHLSSTAPERSCIIKCFLLKLQMVNHVFEWNDTPAQKSLGLCVLSKEKLCHKYRGYWILCTVLIDRTWRWPWTNKNIKCCTSMLTSGMMLTYINIWLLFGTDFKLSQGNIQSLLISLLSLFKIESSRWKSVEGRRNETNNQMYLN